MESDGIQTDAAPRLPAGVGVGRVRLQVADLERSLGFYRDVIGFRPLERSNGVARLGTRSDPRSPTVAEAESTAAAGNASQAEPPVLLELVEKPGARPVPRTGLLGIYHFALLLPSRPDLGRFVRHHAGRGTPFGAADHAFSEALYLEDPDGITIEVYRDRPREEWPVAAARSDRGRDADDAGLPLVSDPLDAAGLMDAAGDDDWAGVPAGSVIGHMHFFVDDLDAAAAFYVDGLGFDRMISIPTALFVAAGGYHHHVGLNTWRRGARTATDEDARLLDWELVVPDIEAREAIADRLEAGGFDVRREEEAGAPAPVARDPWGIEVRITG